MAEIEITLPTVQYGNVKLRATAEELGLDGVGDARELGIVTAVYLNTFTQGFKEGARIDVAAPSAPSQGATEDQAKRMLDEGLGGVTEVPQSGAPWDKPAVDSPAKPWETEVSNW